MPIVLIDADTAAEVMSQLNIGDMVKGYHDDWKLDYNYKLLAKSDYAITLQAPTNKIVISVASTELYRKEIAMRMALPPEEAAPEQPKRRGRPPGTGRAAQPALDIPTTPAAEAPLPQPTFKAPPMPNFSAPPPQATPAAPGPLSAADLQPAALDADSSQTAEEIFGNLNDAVGVFKADLLGLLQNLLDSAAENAKNDAQEPDNRPMQCFDCINIDVPNSICRYFNMQPPMRIIANAVDCEAFTPTARAALGDEIPY